jgi:hypothetical protein
MNHERPLQPLRPHRQRHDAERVVAVHQQLRAVPRARRREAVEAGDDVRVVEEHRRHEDRRRPVVDHRRQPLHHRRCGVGGHLHHLDALLPEPVELAPDGLELPVGGDQPRALTDRQRREEAEEEVVGAGCEGVLAVRVVEQRRESLPHPVGHGERPLPFVVHQLGGIVPGAELAVAGTIGPGLMRVPRQEEAIGHAEGGIVRREPVGRPVEFVSPHRSPQETSRTK